MPITRSSQKGPPLFAEEARLQPCLARRRSPKAVKNLKKLIMPKGKKSKKRSRRALKIAAEGYSTRQPRLTRIDKNLASPEEIPPLEDDQEDQIRQTKNPERDFLLCSAPVRNRT
jgi:hypothetical protein